MCCLEWKLKKPIHNFNWNKEHRHGQNKASNYIIQCLATMSNWKFSVFVGSVRFLIVFSQHGGFWRCITRVIHSLENHISTQRLWQWPCFQIAAISFNPNHSQQNFVSKSQLNRNRAQNDNIQSFPVWLSLWRIECALTCSLDDETLLPIWSLAANEATAKDIFYQIKCP